MKFSPIIYFFVLIFIQYFVGIPIYLEKYSTASFSYILATKLEYSGLFGYGKCRLD